MSDYVVPSVEDLQLSSPLDTLVRRTSSPRRPNAIQTHLPQAGMVEDSESRSALVPKLDAPPKKSFRHPPPSPLLHTRFRTSVATQSSFNTSADLYGHSHSHMPSGSRDIPYDDDASIYSTASTASLPNSSHLSNTLPDNHLVSLSGETQNSVQSSLPSYLSVDGHHGYRSTNSTTDPYPYQRSPSPNSVSVPTVVVSAEEPENMVGNYDDERGNILSSPAPNSRVLVGRTPSSLPKNMNFSRPVRPGGTSEEAKRQVLARNAFRSTLTHSSLHPSPQLAPRSSPVPHLSGHLPLFERQHASPDTPENTDGSPFAPTSSHVPSARPPSNPRVSASSHPVPLLHEPPSSPSNLSIYSAYSYYQLDSPSHSPTGDAVQVPLSPHAPPPHTLSPSASPAPRNRPQQLEPADQFLQEGIQHHEANRLREAAIAFERSATTPGGSGLGMLMWGLTLRHGWGCPKNESLGFSWVRRAAEAAVGDLERARAGIDTSAVRSELVLAIYEVGQCFLQGWGVKKDHKMAVVSCLQMRLVSVSAKPDRTATTGSSVLFPSCGEAW